MVIRLFDISNKLPLTAFSFFNLTLNPPPHFLRGVPTITTSESNELNCYEGSGAFQYIEDLPAKKIAHPIPMAENLNPNNVAEKELEVVEELGTISNLPEDVKIKQPSGQSHFQTQTPVSEQRIK